MRRLWPWIRRLFTHGRCCVCEREQPVSELRVLDAVSGDTICRECETPDDRVSFGAEHCTARSQRRRAPLAD